MAVQLSPVKSSIYIYIYKTQSNPVILVKLTLSFCRLRHSMVRWHPQSPLWPLQVMNDRWGLVFHSASELAIAQSPLMGCVSIHRCWYPQSPSPSRPMEMVKRPMNIGPSLFDFNVFNFKRRQLEKREKGKHRRKEKGNPFAWCSELIRQSGLCVRLARVALMEGRKKV